MADQTKVEQPSEANGAAVSGAGNAPVPGMEDKTVAAVLGEGVWLMSRSPRHRQYLISDLEWLVMPPVLLRQFRMFYEGQQPVALVLYAFLSEEAEQRLEAGAPSLRENEWKSGNHVWIVDVIAPFGEAIAFVKETSGTVLGTFSVKMHASVATQAS